MWIIQNQSLLRLPDDAPLPPQSVKVDPPEDFLTQPQTYKVAGSALTKRPARELKKLQRPRETLKLTQEEIAKIKKAIAEGKL